MGDRIIAYAGKLLIHAVRALLVCWQRMLRLGLSVGALGGLVALVFGAYVTHTIPPAPLTWVAALIFGFALGYAAAMTVLADEMLLSIFEGIRVLEGDVKAGMRAAAVAAEREAGETGRGIMRFLGHRRAASDENPPASPPAPNRAPPSAPLVTLSTVERDDPGHDPANETLAAIAATEEFITTTPRPAVNARPVRADQLPRIGWANDDASALRASGAVVAAATAPALAEMPPLPIRPLRSQPRADISVAEQLREPGALASDMQATQSVSQSAVTRPIAEAEAGNGISGATAFDDGMTQPAGTDEAPTLAFGAVDASPAVSEGVRPDVVSADAETAPAVDRSLAVASQPIESAREERGIWARIGQALIGNTTVPLREVDAAGSGDSGHTETHHS